jgi:hypothetical protein
MVTGLMICVSSADAGFFGGDGWEPLSTSGC